MDKTADLARRIESMIRTGTVAAIDHGSEKKPPRIRIKSGGLLTNWIPWGANRAGKTQTWSPPTIGEQMVLLSPDGDLANAIVMTGAAYQDNHPSPSNSPDEDVKKFPDGAIIKYNHATGVLEATGIKSAYIDASDTALIKCPEVTLDGNLTVTGSITYLSGLTNNGTGSGAKISGDFEHDNGRLSSNGVVLHTHTHTGDAGGETGAPK